MVGLADRLRIMGSLALSLCHLAAGRVDAVCSLKAARSVDIAAAPAARARARARDRALRGTALRRGAARPRAALTRRRGGTRPSSSRDLPQAPHGVSLRRAAPRRSSPPQFSRSRPPPSRRPRPSRRRSRRGDAHAEGATRELALLGQGDRRSRASRSPARITMAGRRSDRQRPPASSTRHDEVRHQHRVQGRRSATPSSGRRTRGGDRADVPGDRHGRPRARPC